jgi:hypothetical protein
MMAERRSALLEAVDAHLEVVAGICFKQWHTGLGRATKYSTAEICSLPIG